MTWLGNPRHHRVLQQETESLLDFGRASVHPDGGFAWLDEDGRPELDRPVALWITCRMTHAYSLGLMLDLPGCAELVDHGLAALTGRLRDAEHGGWWPAVGPEGPDARVKEAYGHAFVVLAGASATAAGRPGARALLDEAVAVLLEHFWDDEAGMVVEEWDAAWTTCDDYRGVNANMHAVEALLAAADVLEDDGLRDRALRITERVVRDLAPAHHWRIPEHFDASWTPQLDYHVDEPAHPFRPYGATIGHWLEWSRLTLHLRASLLALGEPVPDWMLDHARSLFDASVAEGWAVDGAEGFVYTVDWDGRPVVRERMHWVVAEAIATAAALHTTTGDPAYDRWYRTWFEYVASTVRDHERGSWHHELSPTNGPSGITWPGKPDIYHAVGATLVPRLPLSPAMAVALRDGMLRD